MSERSRDEYKVLTWLGLEPWTPCFQTSGPTDAKIIAKWSKLFPEIVGGR